MKVIHVISGGDSGGAKTHLISLAKELVKEIDLKIVCFIRGDFFIEAEKLGLPVVLLEQKRRTDVLFDRKLLNLIEKEKPDIIHAHGARANFMIYLIRKQISCPIITTVHSDYRLDFKDNIYKHIVFTMLNKISLSIFDYFIGVSPEFRKMLIDRGYRENNIFSIYNGIDFEEEINIMPKDDFVKKYSLEKCEGKKVVGNISRLEVVKGVDVFIKGASTVIDQEKEVHFLIAGDGTQRKSLEELVEKLGIQEYVTFLGFITDVPSMLNFIDVNAITSHSESFTYSLLEGARQKKMSIASRVGGLPELIKNGETGLLFNDNDYEKFASCVIQGLWEDDKAQSYGENLYNYAKENFSTTSMKKRHIEIYEEVIRRGKK